MQMAKIQHTKKSRDNRREVSIEDASSDKLKNSILIEKVADIEPN